MTPRRAREIRVESYVNKNPGLTCLELADALSIAPALVRVALQDASNSLKIMRVGNTRATKWYPLKALRA